MRKVSWSLSLGVRSSLAIFVLLFAGLAATGCFERARPYNVVLVSIDTLRADHLGAYGFQKFTISPHFDRLAKESVIFTNAYSTASVTTASHMSMFTGLQPVEHRVNNVVQRPVRSDQLSEFLDPKVRTLPEILADEGYENARFVYSRDFFLDPGLGFGRGYHVDFPFGLDSSSSADWISGWFRDPKARPFFAFVHSKRPHAPYLFPDSALRVAEAEGRLDRGYDGPVIDNYADWKKKFSSKNWFGNHIPGLVPDCWIFEGLIRKGNAKDRRRVEQLYAVGVNVADLYLGRLVSALRDSGALENTILVVTSDHGEQLLQRGSLSHMTLFREETNVPLLIRLPEKLRGKGLRDRVTADVQTTDILPTVLSLLGIRAPEGISGRDLTPLMRGAAESVHSEIFGFNLYPVIERTAFVRTPEWSFVQGEAESFLFDRAADPQELLNVAAKHPHVVKDMVMRLKRRELAGFSYQAAP